MPVFVRDDKSVLFIHIPKTGGSSLERNLADIGWRELFSIRGLPADQLTFLKATPQHFHADLTEQIFNFEEFSAVVALVRDPFNRLKSEFYWQFRKAASWPDPIDWIDGVLAEAEGNPFLFDNHIRPQVDFFPNGVDVTTFKLEEDGVQQAQLFICGGEEERPKGLKDRFLKGKSKRMKSSTYRPEIETSFAERRQAITEFYSADYARFGYRPDGLVERP